MGLGYTVSIIVMSALRQILATGMLTFENPFNVEQSIFAFRLIPEDYVISMFSQPVGAFITFALLAGALAAYKNRQTAKEEKKEAAAKAALKEAK